MSFELTVMAAGDPITQTNLITAPITAAAVRNIRGWDNGVLDNSFLSTISTDENYTRTPSDMWELSGTTNMNISIKAGMASAYGFDIYNDSTRVFSVGQDSALATPASGTKYVFFYLKWNFGLNPPIGTLDLFDNGSNSSFTPSPQDNLATNPIGSYVMPLYRIAIDTSGNISNVTKWESLGTVTYKGVKWSRLSDIAAQAKKVNDNSSSSNTVMSFIVGSKIITMEY